jgi:hypothetical protein
VAVRWAPSADKHGVVREQTLYAIGHAEHVVAEFDEPRVAGTARPTLYIGPAGRGGPLIEVLVVITPPRDVFVFHAMPLRQVIAERAGYHHRQEDNDD